MHHAGPQEGLTLLDYHAAHALQGLLAGNYHVAAAGGAGDGGGACDTAALADTAYGLAAEMLAVRGRWLERVKEAA
jgi:hypothetical protein